MQDLAVQLLACGDIEKGLTLAGEALEKIKLAVGADSPAALRAAELLADCHGDNGDKEKAAAVLKEAGAARVDVLTFAAGADVHPAFEEAAE
jgi:hypothetical protein